LSEAAAPLTA
jgi:uncharacterized protein YndB with AHSA1/START domain